MNLATLRRLRAAAEARRARFLRLRQYVKAQREEATIQRLDTQILKLQRAPNPRASGTRRRPADVDSRDKYAGVKITPENAADMVAHYRWLVRTTFPLTARHRAYRARLHEAQRFARSYRRGAKRHHPEVVRRQKAQAEQNLRRARARGDRRAVSEAENQIERYNRMIAAEAMEQSAAYEAPNARTSEEIQAQDASMEPTSADTAIEPFEEERPWYMRPWVWALGAVAVGAGLAMRRGRGGKAAPVKLKFLAFKKKKVKK